MASIRVDSTIPAPHVVPTEVYSASFPITSPVLLRIATGGAGQSGLVRALADAFIEHEVQARGCKPFAVAWLASDTSASFNHLASRAADLSITYHVVAEEVAIRQGIADRSVYAWRDHWLLVGMYGPKCRDLGTLHILLIVLNVRDVKKVQRATQPIYAQTTMFPFTITSANCSKPQ